MRKVVITISIDDELLAQLDELAASSGQSRSKLIQDSISERLEYIETIAESLKVKEKNNGC